MRYKILIFIIFVFIFGTSSNGFCSKIEDSQAIRAIIGESANQGYKGMLAIACAIRNRGHLRGVYGAKNSCIDSEPSWVWELAKKAWEASKTVDIVDGADHWENINAFGKPEWAKNMVKTKQIGDHTFYKKRDIQNGN